MSSTSLKTPQQKADEYNAHQHTDNSEQPDLREEKTNDSKEGQNEKTQNEVVLNMDDENLKTAYSNKNFVVFDVHNVVHVPTKRKVHSTLVYFGDMGRNNFEPSGPPLDYQPDRNDFIRLVMILLFIMLITTALCVGTIMYVDAMSQFFKDFRLPLLIVGIVITLITSYAITCSACARSFPCNIIFLFVAVIGMILVCGVVTVRYKTEIVMLAVLATAGVVIVCVCLAFTSFDFTSWILYLVVIGAAIGFASLGFGIYTLITGNYIKWLRLVILIAGTLVESLVLIAELQMVLGGKAVEIGEDDYALAAYMLYTSIIDIFIKLVKILGILDS